MLLPLPFTTSQKHLPSLANEMIPHESHLVNKEKLGSGGSGPLHKKKPCSKARLVQIYMWIDFIGELCIHPY